MSQLVLEDCEHKVKAKDACLSKSSFEDCLMLECRFSEVNLGKASFMNVDFCGVSIQDSRYEGMTIEGVEVLKLLAAYRAQVEAES